MLIEDFFEHLETNEGLYTEAQIIAVLAKECDIITNEDSALVSAARNAKAAMDQFDRVYSAATIRERNSRMAKVKKIIEKR